MAQCSRLSEKSLLEASREKPFRPICPIGIRNCTGFSCKSDAFPPPIWPDTGKDRYFSKVPATFEIPFEEWQAAGLEQNSLVVDPRAQVTEANFVLPLDSPALKAGFLPYDWSQCGPRTCKVERDIMTGAVRSQMAATVSQRCAATLLSEAGIETPQGLETASKCDVGDRGIAENKQPSGLCDSLV